jgi:germination protein M
MRKTMRSGAPLLLLSVSLLVTGCGLGGEKAGTELDPPKVNYVKEGKSLDKKDKAANAESI